MLTNLAPLLSAVAPRRWRRISPQIPEMDRPFYCLLQRSAVYLLLSVAGTTWYCRICVRSVVYVCGTCGGSSGEDSFFGVFSFWPFGCWIRKNSSVRRRVASTVEVAQELTPSARRAIFFRPDGINAINFKLLLTTRLFLGISQSLLLPYFIQGCIRASIAKYMKCNQI